MAFGANSPPGLSKAPATLSRFMPLNPIPLDVSAPEFHPATLHARPLSGNDRFVSEGQDLWILGEQRSTEVHNSGRRHHGHHLLLSVPSII